MPESDAAPPLPSWYRAATAPKAIAIVGASGNPAKNHYQRQLSAYGFRGDIYPVNPKEEVIDGLPAYPGVDSIPAEVDLALIALPAHLVPQALHECVRVGIPAVYTFASGFSETGSAGAELEQQVREILTRSQGWTRMLGPNGTGILSVDASMVATPLGAQQVVLQNLRNDGVAMTSQSGLVSSAVFIASQQASLGLGLSIAIGNEVDLGLADVIEALVADPSVSVILAYLEGLRDPAAFLRAARAASAAGKPIVALKGGATTAGAAAAASHTASIAGSDRVFSGILSQMRVRRANSITHLVDVARVLAAYPRLSGSSATILTGSGGVGIMLTDLLAERGFRLAQWGAEQRIRLDTLLPEFLQVGNPLDGAGDFAWARAPLEAAVKAAEENQDTDFIVVALGGMPDAEESVAAEILRLCTLVTKPLFAAWVGGLGTALRQLNEGGVPAFGDLEALADALVTAVAPDLPTGVRSETGSDVPAGVRDLVAEAVGAHLAEGRSSIDEVSAKAMLKAAGIPVVDEGTARDADEAVALGSDIGYPMVLKLRAPGVMHKSELGGVALGVSGDDELRRVALRLLGIAQDRGIVTADLVLQRQLPPGVELLLGMHRDPTFGPVVSLGVGGMLTEALDDIQCFSPDVEYEELVAALRRFRHPKLFAGYRHWPAVRPEMLWPVVRSFASLVRALPPGVREIDINPLIVGEDAIVAVDALVVLGDRP